MNFADPQPLTDIIGKLDARTPIGSLMRSAEWAQVPQGLRDRAVFSAGVESVRWLSALDNGIKDMVTRARSTNERGEAYWKTDRAKLVADLRQLGQSIGINHPDGPRAGSQIREKDITDPLSIRRLKLIVNTQLDMAYGYGDYLAAHDPTVLEQWPCQELVRISPRANPRDWVRRWVAAGGRLFNGRMIARKGDEIWSKISRFGNPYPPFDYESGMGVEDVDYDEAVELGVIGEGEQIEGNPIKDFNDGLESSVSNLDAKQQGWLKALLGDHVEIQNGVAKWVPRSATATAPRPQPAPAPAPTPATPPTPTPATPVPRKTPALKRRQVNRAKAVAKPMRDLAKQFRKLDPLSADFVQQRETLIEAARSVVEIPQTERGAVAFGRVDSSAASIAKGGAAILERFVHPSLFPVDVEVDGIQGRSGAGAKHISIRLSALPQVMAHELMHCIEWQLPEIMQKSVEFLELRGGKVSPVQLRQVYPGSGYHSSEITLEDEWIEKGGTAYTGRVYKRPVTDAYYGTEILSTGIERLLANPIEFFQSDPDYFNYVITTIQTAKPS